MACVFGTKTMTKGYNNLVNSYAIIYETLIVMILYDIISPLLKYEIIINHIAMIISKNPEGVQYF